MLEYTSQRGGIMKKEEKISLEKLTNQDTILIKKSFLLALIPKIEDKEIQRMILNILKSLEVDEKTKQQAEIEISIGVLKMFIPDLSSIPSHAYKLSESYYENLYNNMNYEERMFYKEAVHLKTCTNCSQSNCPFYQSSTNQIDCSRWNNPCIIGKEYLLKREK